MRVVALISGGKDSTFNMMQCIAAGHEIVALANLLPVARTEIDSYMYQSVGFEAIDFIAAALELPLFKKETLGKSNQQGKTYEPVENEYDEVEDLFELLSDVKASVEIDAVSVGAILSDYQRVRVENVCIRLGLTPLAYLWQRNQKELLNEMIKCEVDAIVIKVASIGLEPSKHLGRSLSLLQPHLSAINKKYGVNICGEGGEYETLTIDCPLFKSRIIIEDSEIIIHSNDSFAPVGYLKFNRLKLQNKLPVLDLSARLEGLPLKDSDGYVTDPGEDVQELNDTEIDNNDSCLNSTNDINLLNRLSLPEQKVTFARSQGGWLWIGGVQGYSTNPRESMEKAMKSLKCVLEANHKRIQDVVSLTMFISNMDDYLDLNNIYCETFNHVNPPTRACVQIPLSKECPVILEALSWSDTDLVPTDPPIERTTMHVQSRSHWAPANIGPYSQGVAVGDFVYLAGQIGLVPGNLTMVKGGIKSQCRLALRHVERLLKAMDNNINLRDVVQGICYVTDISYVDTAIKLWEEMTNNAIVDYIVVSNLPKNALIEWHVWAHRHNKEFEYEETGKCVETWSISIFRRWNYENNVAAIVCHLESSIKTNTITENIFMECINYTIQKLRQGHENDSDSLFNIKIFYPTFTNADKYAEYLENKKNIALVFSFVPVRNLKTINTYLSICGVRIQ